MAGRQAGRQAELPRKKPRFKGDVGVVSIAMGDQGGGMSNTEIGGESTGTVLRAPFPWAWFGGKSRVASLVWSRFGAVGNYCEPFAGSLAVLLGRPSPPRVETVNDIDAMLANFWRALQRDPEAVAYWCDWPVNETDLHARHRWLVSSRKARSSIARVKADPEFFDAKIAGWWVYGQCLWIGSGWCQTQKSQPQGLAVSCESPHEGVVEERLSRKRFAGTGNGQGCGVHRRWNGGGQGGGSGIHAPTLTQQKLELRGDSGATGSGVIALGRSAGLYDYLGKLSDRLRRVRVCCGDWTRVLTPSVTTYVGLTGVLLDPPYSHDLRERCYAEDHDISADVRAWAIEHGDDPKFRIALCGYEGEHEMPSTWECVPWKAHGGYSRTERGVANRSKERIWFSKHCLKPDLLSNLEQPA